MRAHKSSGGSGRKRARTGVDAVKLVGVIEQRTGMLLFQRVYRWASEANPKALGNLAMSFFQFSREIDDGSISCVNFEKPAHSGSGHRRQASNQMRWKMRTAVETMQLLCASGAAKGFTVLLFHEISGGSVVDVRQDAAVRDLLLRLRDAFEADFGARVEEMAPRIRAMAETPGGPTDEMVATVQEAFAGFEAAAEQARGEAFQRPTARTANGSVGSLASLLSSNGEPDAMAPVAEEEKKVS